MKTGLLTLCGVVYGIIGGWLFRRYSDRPALRLALNRSIAHILEFRLFIDEPRLIFQAQLDLVRANFAFVRAILMPSAIAFGLLLATYFPLQNAVGSAPLQAGDVAIVSLQTSEAGVELVAPFGVMVETPPLRVRGENLTLWRIRALSPVTGDFQTRPRAMPVTVDYPTAMYFGMPWWVLFGLVSTLASAAAFTEPNKASSDQTSSPESGTA